MQIKVSVIMTTYNCIDFLEESISSVLKQSLKDIELVCVDGDSYDGTAEYISEQKKIDSRVKLYSQDGKGIGAAKNTGIKKAKGEFITFLDADDLYVDDKALEKLYTSAKNVGARICGGLRSTIELDGSISLEPLHRADLEAEKNGIWLDYRDRQYDYHFHSYLYDRKMIIDSDARFAETRCYDDTHFFIRAMLEAKRFYIIPVELYRYRLGKGYKWNDDQCHDAIVSLIDQLNISSQFGLEMLHWLTLQRINKEYKDNFVKSVRNGCLDNLSLLLEANNAISVKLIKDMEKKEFPEGYLETMLHCNRSELPIRFLDDLGCERVILEPIWELLYPKLESTPNQAEVSQLRDKLEDDNRVIMHILNSTSYRIGRVITWFPRMIRKVFRAVFN